VSVMNLCLLLTSALFSIPAFRFWKKGKRVPSTLYYCLTMSSILYHSRMKFHRRKIEVVDKSLAHTLMLIYTGIGISQGMHWTAASTVGVSVFYYIRKVYKLHDNTHCIVHIVSVFAILRYINQKV
jgi:hypothetical protein